MARAKAQTGPNIIVKVRGTKGTQDERTIGFCDGINISVMQGQRMIHGVDSPFPYEINQGAAPSYVKGTMNLYLPQGTSLEAAGLVPYRTDAAGNNYLATTTPTTIKLYERSTGNMLYSIEGLKVGSYSMSIVAKKVVRVQIQFEAKYLIPGKSNDTKSGEPTGF